MLWEISSSRRIRRICAIAAALAALSSPGVARADAVTDWNAYAGNALAVTARLSPTAASLHMAMVQGAMYDAVNGIDRGYRPYLVLPAAQPWDSMDAAAATAAYRVLVSIVPAQQPALEPLYQASLAQVPDGPPKDGGIAAGETAAAAMIAARTGDGRFGSFRFTASLTPGAWRPELPLFASDPFAWAAYVKPFLIEGPSQFRSDGPNGLTSDAYTADFAEVKAVGARNNSTRTADQTEQALYWGAEHGTLLWGRIIRTISANEGLSVSENARLFAMVQLASADANINCWNDKAYWSSWRPITAIRLADTDGNPATDADPAWEPLLATPRSRNTRRATPAAAGRSSPACRTSSAPTRSRSRPSAPAPEPGGATPASPRRSRKSSTRGSMPESTSERPTCRERSSARRSRTGRRSTTSSPRTETDTDYCGRPAQRAFR
jgi:hypothetical protein